jgi:hypothetical protein
MKATLESGNGDLTFSYDMKVYTGEGTGERRVRRLARFDGCSVRFTDTSYRIMAHGPDKETHRSEYKLSLGDIDTDTIDFGPIPADNAYDHGKYAYFSAFTRNDEQKIAAKAFDHDPVFEYDTNELSFEFDSDYGVRFAKAFKHAVKMCGGKPSIF